MTIIKLLSLIFFLNLQFCTTKQNVEYYIERKYSGPCTIFFSPKNFKDTNYVLIKGGLAKAALKNINRNFLLKDEESKNVIPIIQLGNERSADSLKRYIFGLTKNKSSTRCIDEDVETITFYIGYRENYLLWMEKNQSYFEYYDSHDIDWCKYFKYSE